MATIPNDALEQVLTQYRLAWSIIPWERHCSLSTEWDDLFGDISHWLRQKRGGKAQYEYSQQAARTFRIVPFLGARAGCYSIGKKRQYMAAYECHGEGNLPDLSAFAPIDFFVAPADFDWTMIYTHEDESYGGPHFLRKDWLGAPRRRRDKRTTTD